MRKKDLAKLGITTREPKEKEEKKTKE